MSKIKDDETFFMNTVHLIEAGRMISDVYNAFDDGVNLNGIIPPSSPTMTPPPSLFTIPIGQDHHEWKKQSNIMIKDGIYSLHTVYYQIHLNYYIILHYDMKIKLRLHICAHKICQLASVFRRFI